MNIYDIIVGIILLIALGFIWILRPKNDSLHRNLDIKILKRLLFIGVLVAIFCFFHLGKKIYRNGIGKLFTDYAETESENNRGNEETEYVDGNTLVIVVSLDQIKIEDSTYTDIGEIKYLIEEAVNTGKKIRLIDDYALASTYNDIVDVITQMNVSRSSIEEIEQP